MRKLSVVMSIMVLSLYVTGCGNSSKPAEEPASTSPAGYESNNSLYNTRNIEAVKIDFVSTTPVNNKAAYVPSQCYTKTMDSSKGIHNPCYSCHINSREPNYVDDADIQLSYGFSEYTKTNRFTNLFKDRSALVAKVSDEEIISYVRENNYIQHGEILLAQKLKEVPKEWDLNGDGKWNGYLPDCYFNFDEEGFDRSRKGDFSGWRAFGYYPFLGTFWPTNGSMDDVMIRLPEVFRQDENGQFDRDVYKLNLSIVESLIKQKTIEIDAVDEVKYGVDLNQNGVLDRAETIVFRWKKPAYDSGTGKIGGFSMSYVGRAKSLLESNEYLIAPGLFPKHTEFLHSVRYLDGDESTKSVAMAPRMKELRYAKKRSWISYAALSNATLSEIKERYAFPDRLRTIMGNTERGLSNNLGWVFQGFIEDARGELRPQNYEETQSCIGCHSGIGAIADSTFAFQRKFEHGGFQNSWYHWGQDAKGLKDIQEPKTPDARDEYSLYLEVNHAGDEFRTNEEVIERFFDENGTVKNDAIAVLKKDISYLLVPSVQRALQLNKAYKIIVEEQSYIYGRDAHVTPVANVHKELSADTATGIKEPVRL